ncbi:MAG: export transporter permease protein [Gammaproteobacteria bacterium]|jgi:ABC-2 type transport system permease protein|nr:export transporter permease protein [Gammaproteobacteria bacterium]
MNNAVQFQDSFLLRLWAMLKKEFIHMRRDKVTVGLILWIPVIQLIIFGYAINTNPKHLPAALLLGDDSPYVRAFVTGMQNTDYFHIVSVSQSEEESQNLLRENKVLFVFSIPPNFTRDFLRGNKPSILVEADATDGVAIGPAMQALTQLSKTVFDPFLLGGAQKLRYQTPSFQVISHPLYNPENITSYSIIPGLLGVILTMSMITVTAQAITREIEKGTIESLLATPIKPQEVMLGKMIPYIVLGYGQAIIILILAKILFDVPMYGSLILLFVCAFPFVIANLAVGLFFSTLANNQLQAMQMTFFFFLPSILLSGFMFPFYGMPHWATFIGEGLPLTHMIRITRGILLKDNGIMQVWDDVWPMLLFACAMLVFAMKRYRQTLD